MRYQNLVATDGDLPYTIRSREAKMEILDNSSMGAKSFCPNSRHRIRICSIAALLAVTPFYSSLVAQTPHTVTLTWAWNQGDGPVATGFNVKRGTASGGPYATVASLTGTTIRTYTDASGTGNLLTPGTTYYYVVTAVSGSVESSPSPEAQALIPASAPGAPIFIFISGLANGAAFTQAYAPGMALSVFGSQLAPSAEAASGVPLPISMAGVDATVNGVAAPLYYVSPGQLNLQIPYETAVNTTATLQINNNGQAASQTFPVAAAAPGIFTDQTGAIVPSGSAANGQITTLFMTGAGSMNPPIPTGAAPASGTPVANLPQPSQTTIMTVGGFGALIDFIGVPPGLVGVIQINFQVPSGVGIGPQPVIVTIGVVASKPAQLTITQ
jgi:uncharacterized protein (TIGR03437 family)